ncbi:hypothetical protein BDY17DRAFT_290132 [Neohortaea acidophila]|uniref:F-box domain-containing protein n=1 Tax=Neohortaea acidophila TaxID=245834 RepID=A0A6A6Q6W8_9PEZI|nr:uncharacterized protein BDY17DRAFT_290132 [Neohortaea acidophila]KAF2488032.1 hypothetical protein BDY17DRAFT_290132 [Neohortaea acidophila]
MISTVNADEHPLSVMYQQDPFIVLPTELILQIFNNLPLFHTWTLRRVCRRWNYVLSSDECMHAAVEQWDTHDREDSAGLRRLTGRNRFDHRLRHFQNMKAKNYEWCQIIDLANRGDHGGNILPNSLKTRCKGRRVAYVSEERGQDSVVVVHDLVSVEKRLLPARSQMVENLVLTTLLVAWTTQYDGSMYFSYLDETPDQVTRVQLPSAEVFRAEGDGEMVVLIERDRWSSPNRFGNILLYDAGARQLQRFDVHADAGLRDADNLGHRLNACSLYLDRQRRFVHLFFLATIPNIQGRQPNRALVHARMAFDGTWVKRQYDMTSEDDAEPVCRGYLRLTRPHSTGRPDKIQFRIIDGPFPRGQRYRHRAAVRFNAAQSEIAGIDSCARADELYGDAGPAFLLWKGQAYHPGTPKDWTECGSQMNDSFMITVETGWRQPSARRRSRIRAYCFDPDVRMPEDGMVDDGDIASPFVEPREARVIP